MEHCFAVQAALAKPLGARMACMPRLQTYNLSQGGGFSSSSPPRTVWGRWDRLRPRGAGIDGALWRLYRRLKLEYRRKESSDKK